MQSALPDRQEIAAVVVALESQSRLLRTPCGGGSMVWHAFGNGTPLFLFHGGHGSWTHWFKNIPVLAERFQVIAADLPGYGDSALPPQPHTLASLAEIVAAGIRDLIGHRRCYLMGFSFGSMIGSHVARILGDQVIRLVLIAVNGLGVPRGNVEDMHRWRELTDETEIIAAHRRNLAIMMFADENKIDPLSVFLQFDNTRRARLHGRKLSSVADLRDCIAQIKAPMTVIWGEKDVAAGGAFDARIAALRELKPGVRTIIIPGIGHWTQYEGADAFNKIALAELVP
jgi:2-hydroxy-6-oxonona-2,4-dienedioate hydrolase